MPKRAYLAIITALLFGFATVIGLQGAETARADDAALVRSHTIEMVYVRSDNYKNRLVNAKAAFDQMLIFFQKVEMRRGRHYSFLRDVLRYNMPPEQGYVMTPKGYAYGSCGAPSALNKLVQTAKFRDSDGVEKPIFQTIVIYWWKGDKTYGEYGANIFLDPTGTRKNKDYIWRVNPAYDGPAPKLTASFDMEREAVTISLTYADEPLKVKAQANVPTPTTVPTSRPTSVKTAKTAQPTAAPTIAPTTAPAVASIETFENDNAVDGAMPPQSNSAKDNLTKSGRAAMLTDQLQAIIKKRRFGVSVVPIGASSEVIGEFGINRDLQQFVASSFKGPVALYFFENISPEVWGSLPIAYWSVEQIEKVPEEHRVIWLKYHDILRDVYWNTVFSENQATGNILMYVYQNSVWSTKAANPIIAFNEWSQQSVGISAESGLHLWLAGRTQCRKCNDERYNRKPFVYGTKLITPNNTFSPRDVAQYYVHLATKGRERGYYAVATELLSTIARDRSMLEYLSNQLGIHTASKDGFVGPYSEYSDGFYISTDAGLLTMPDGTQYAVSFMAFDAGDLMAESITTVLKGLLKNTNSEIFQVPN
jgi:hypothetical protein